MSLGVQVKDLGRKRKEKGKIEVEMATYCKRTEKKDLNGALEIDIDISQEGKNIISRAGGGQYLVFGPMYRDL
jgi:hypothetical protein